MQFERALKSKILQLSTYFPVVAISGARQAGKTTLLRQTFNNYRYVSLDLPSMAEQAERNPAQFLANNPPPILIDEMQYAPALFRQLKMKVDTDRHNMGQYVITGSQHFNLMKGVTESLAGRVGLLELENLSVEEIGQHLKICTNQDTLVSAMVRGQFPELWRLPDFPAHEFFSSYLATYLERDVRQILNVTSLRDFERFLRIMAARSGGMLNKSDVARDVGVSMKAVGDWLSVLQASGQIVVLEPWYTNITKRIVKTPKVYLRDSGLLCFLLNLTDQTILGSPLLGSVWETFIFSELRKLNATLDNPVNFWYYRDQRSREIDFILETGGRLSFIEAKYQEQPAKKDTATVQAISQELTHSNIQWTTGSQFIAGTTQNRYPISEEIDAVGINDLRTVLGEITNPIPR